MNQPMTATVESVETLAHGLYTQDNAQKWDLAPEAVKQYYRTYARRLVRLGVVRLEHELTAEVELVRTSIKRERAAATHWARQYHELELKLHALQHPTTRRPWHQRALDALLGPSCPYGCGERLFEKDRDRHFANDHAGDPTP